MNFTTALIFGLVFGSVVNVSYQCIELLNGQWRQMSVEERAERADVVLVVNILEKYHSKDVKRWYSAKCEIFEVLKGWENFGKSPDNSKAFKERTAIIIHGFGRSLDCLSDVEENRTYLLFGMFKVDQNLWATYFTSFGAVEAINEDVYDRALSALGLNRWEPWSKCSKSCESGVTQRSRTCATGTDCDYCWTAQWKICNWQNCQNIIFSNEDFEKKTNLDLKNTGIISSRKMVISIQWKKNSVENNNSKGRKTAFVFNMIDGKDQFGHFSVTNDGFLQASIKDVSIKQNVLRKNFNFTGSEQSSIELFFNETDIIVSGDCQILFLREFRGQTKYIFDYKGIVLQWEKSSDVEVKLSMDSFDSYKKSVCHENVYNYSAKHTKHQLKSLHEAIDNSKSSLSPKETEIQWSNWTSCSVTCGLGWQKREQLCYIKNCDRSQMKTEIKSCFVVQDCSGTKCSKDCRNDSKCVGNKCFCSAGYTGELCNEPVCNEGCKNGGKCVAPDSCECIDGFTGEFCEIPECNLACQNGGQCIQPNICACQYGFEGKTCEIRTCRPSCQNNGTCESGNLCKCPEGFTGNRCEKFECFPQCMNGGACVGRNKCRCPPEFYGSFCERHYCLQCLNGGECVDDMCHCRDGFYGSQCQSKTCATTLKFHKIIRPVILYFPIIHAEKMCVNSECKPVQPQRSVVVNKVIFKPFLDCA